jgi:hypothetical protein
VWDADDRLIALLRTAIAEFETARPKAEAEMTMRMPVAPTSASLMV